MGRKKKGGGYLGQLHARRARGIIPMETGPMQRPSSGAVSFRVEPAKLSRPDKWYSANYCHLLEDEDQVVCVFGHWSMQRKREGVCRLASVLEVSCPRDMFLAAVQSTFRAFTERVFRYLKKAPEPDPDDYELENDKIRAVGATIITAHHAGDQASLEFFEVGAREIHAATVTGSPLGGEAMRPVVGVRLPTMVLGRFLSQAKKIKAKQ